MRVSGPRTQAVTAVAGVVAGVSVAGYATAWTLAVLNRDALRITADFGPDRFLIGYTVAGVVLAARRPVNPVGWLMLGIGLVTACRGVAGEYALHALAGSARPASGVWAAWFVNWSLTLLFPGGVLTFLLLLFPNGHVLGPRWRAAGLLGAGVSLLFILINWLDPGPVMVNGLPRLPNPTGIAGAAKVARNGLAGNAAWALALACFLVATVSVFVRYRRSAGEERLQLKWFAYTALLSLILLLALLPTTATHVGQVAFDVAIVVGIGLALPLAIGVAVLKYRLYAIDRIISRSVSYAVVTGLVVGVYLGCVAVLTDVLPLRGSVGVAVAVLAAAAVFNPLRHRVQAVVDRRFDRARYDTDRVVARFAGQLREQVDLEVLGADLLAVVNHVLAPEHLALWLNEITPAARRAESRSAASRPAGELALAAQIVPGNGRWNPWMRITRRTSWRLAAARRWTVPSKEQLGCRARCHRWHWPQRRGHDPRGDRRGPQPQPGLAGLRPAVRRRPAGHGRAADQAGRGLGLLAL